MGHFWEKIAPELTEEQNSRTKNKRGPRKKVSPNKSIKIYYNNINGFKSKHISLKKIINETTPDIIALCETKREILVRKKDDIPGYDLIERNTRQGKEGLMTI